VDFKEELPVAPSGTNDPDKFGCNSGVTPVSACNFTIPGLAPL
jgi:hypothetical protein